MTVFNGPTTEQVEQAVRELQGSDPKQSITVRQVVQQIDPHAVAMVQACAVDQILWAESVSNILKDLGRSGRLRVTLIQDDRGYENPVVQP